MTTVFRPDFLYFQVLTSCQALDATTQLIETNKINFYWKSLVVPIC